MANESKNPDTGADEYAGRNFITNIWLAPLSCLMASGEKNPALNAGFYGVMFGAALASLLIVCVDRKLR